MQRQWFKNSVECCNLIMSFINVWSDREWPPNKYLPSILTKWGRVERTKSSLGFLKLCFLWKSVIFFGCGHNKKTEKNFENIKSFHFHKVAAVKKIGFLQMKASVRTNFFSQKTWLMHFQARLSSSKRQRFVSISILIRPEQRRLHVMQSPHDQQGSCGKWISVKIRVK